MAMYRLFLQIMWWFYVFQVYELASVKTNDDRANLLQIWLETGGVMIMGYEMYRNLSTLRNIRKKKLKEAFTETLVNPGEKVTHLGCNL